MTTTIGKVSGSVFKKINKMKNSKLFSWNFNDLARGFVLAVLTAFITIISTTIEAGSLTFHWPTIGKTVLIAGLAYLKKNFFTNSKNQFATKELTNG